MNRIESYGYMKAVLEAIAAGPADRHPGVAAMQGAPAGRFRVHQGDRRAVFRVEGGDILVLRVGHRTEVHER